MKKWAASLMIVLFVMMTIAPAANAASAKGKGRGGFMGFIAGCCFGIRTGNAYNEGKEIHFREWCTLIPYVGLVFTIWNGIDCAGGATTSSLAAKYGATYY